MPTPTSLNRPIPTDGSAGASTSTPSSNSTAIFSTKVQHITPTVVFSDSTLTNQEILRLSYSYDKQVSDGSLILYASQIGQDCHKIYLPSPKNKQPVITVELVFQNISEKPLVIETEFKLTQGRLTDLGFLYFYGDGERLHISSLTPDEFSIPTTFVYIPAHESYKHVITLGLPIEIRSDNGPWELIPAGQYYVKFLYVNDHQKVGQQEDVWTGIISSNPVEFCVKE